MPRVRPQCNRSSLQDFPRLKVRSSLKDVVRDLDLHRSFSVHVRVHTLLAVTVIILVPLVVVHPAVIAAIAGVTDIRVRRLVLSLGTHSMTLIAAMEAAVTRVRVRRVSLSFVDPATILIVAVVRGPDLHVARVPLALMDPLLFPLICPRTARGLVRGLIPLDITLGHCI
ncbi:hypothetical protein C8F01DRAFT_1249321 [Mycena amicta]|nr:hypothetical protein C8F01DRAFT_1249321 [Mycena amicta]